MSGQTLKERDRFGLPERADGLRRGYTSGVCAQAAAKAAAFMLLFGERIDHVRVVIPEGAELILEVREISAGPDRVCCAVRKESGDDPDVTDGILVYAEVSPLETAEVRIEGGSGVGRVTKPGLDQPVGAAAINSVPRRMIRRDLEELLKKTEDVKGLSVLISVPEGERLALKTFNPKLGIIGGISILGTSGIVEPMSEDSLKTAIYTEMNMRRAEGYTTLLATPGRYGLSFLKERGIPEELPVVTSNFVADSVSAAADKGFSGLLFAGHLGKLVKVAAGARNTHSRYGMRPQEVLEGLFREEGYALPEGEELPVTSEALWQRETELHPFAAEPLRALLAERIRSHMEAFCGGRMQTEVIVFWDGGRERAESTGAGSLLGRLSEEYRRIEGA